VGETTPADSTIHELSTGDPVDNSVPVNFPRDFDQQDVRYSRTELSFSPDRAMSSTESGGQLNQYDVGHVDDSKLSQSGDLGSAALAAARAIASGRAQARLRGRRSRRPDGIPRYSAARADERDPAPLGAIVDRAIPELGWVRPLAEARVLGMWASIVGADIAAHSQPVTLTDGDLKITAESTAWATQLRLLAPRILAKICEQTPPGLVKRLSINGPSGPSWKRGPWSMPGGRGVRDTYG